MKKKIRFFETHVPPNYPTYPTHSHHTFHSTLSPLFGWLTHSPSFLFYFLSYTPLYSYILSHRYFHTTISTIILWQDRRKILENL